MHLSWSVNHEDHGQRAVDVLIRRTGMSRSMAKKIRLYGRLTCNGRDHRMIDPVYTGDQLVATYQANPDMRSTLHPDHSLDICYIDNWLLVVNKPAGMVTHPTYLHDQGSLTGLLADFPLHPVNRLDRDTSGLVLIARNGHAHYVISRNPMRKIYVGLVHGQTDDCGIIDAPIRRADGSIILREVHDEGAHAQTRWKRLHYFPYSDISFLKFELLTGRTHQIRVHCQHAGFPLIGDGLYGRPPLQGLSSPASFDPDKIIGRQALHAASLTFHHPISHKEITVTAKLPADFRRLMTCLFQFRPN
jgi:23S rRNA pseudouridine1911/1915/1917 synthase